jgi:methyltransferase (TIGR00027 family)
MSLKDKTSETALVTLSLRALSNYERDEKIKTHDTLAEIFLPDERKIMLANIDSRAKIRKSIPQGLYEYVIARTHYFDNIFASALKNNIDQIVFLGAGYDCRPYRFAGFIKNTKIFELDKKPTQNHKVSILRENNVEIPKNISFVPVDFENDDFLSLLLQYGYDKFKPTLFIWEGVTFYLFKDTVIQMLKTIKENSGSGSRVCFDFQTIQSEKDLINTGLKAETIKFGIESGKITNFVTDNQYTVIEHLTASDMEKQFLTLQNGDLFGKIAPIMNFLLIEKT